MEIKIEAAGYGEDKLKDLAFGKRVMDVLEKYYPLHPWFVDTSHQAGTVTVQLMYDGKDGKKRIWKYGYLLHIKKLEVDDLEKKVYDAGGEVLERYHMARESASMNSIVDFYEKGVDAHAMVN